MTATLWQGIGLFLLVVTLTGGEALCQRRSPLHGRPRLARMVILATTAGGVIGATAWMQALPWSFSWDLPPLAFRFLAVAGLAFGVCGLLALARPSPARSAQFLGLLGLYLGPLTLAILALHLDRFSFDRPVVIAFFAIVLLLLAGLAATLPQLPPRLSRPQGAIATLTSLIAAAWGLALFLWPAGPLPLIWPWPSDALTSRLIAAMFLTVAAAQPFAGDRASRISAHALTATYGCGIALACLAQIAQGKPAPLAYLYIWGALGLLNAAKLLTARATAPSHASSRRG